MIALATAAQYPQLAPDDQVLHAAFAARGLPTQPVVWDSAADWSSFDTVVVRSIWDYHLKYARFQQWLEALQVSGAAVHNAVSILRHNADKRYLVDLERAGVRITPTRVVTASDDLSFGDVLRETGWKHVVVKPTVSSTGYETWFTEAPATHDTNRRFADQLERMDVLVQEFAEGVSTGELSFVFLAGGYSHCVLKRAAADEFRVHIEHGGTVELYDATAAQISWAESVIDTVDSAWTYARVDAVMQDGGPMLMELELLDPELFFSYYPDACDKFIDSIIR